MAAAGALRLCVAAAIVCACTAVSPVWKWPAGAGSGTSCGVSLHNQLRRTHGVPNVTLAFASTAGYGATALELASLGGSPQPYSNATTLWSQGGRALASVARHLEATNPYDMRPTAPGTVDTVLVSWPSEEAGGSTPSCEVGGFATTSSSGGAVPGSPMWAQRVTPCSRASVLLSDDGTTTAILSAGASGAATLTVLKNGTVAFAVAAGQAGSGDELFLDMSRHGGVIAYTIGTVATFVDGSTGQRKGTPKAVPRGVRMSICPMGVWAVAGSTEAAVRRWDLLKGDYTLAWTAPQPPVAPPNGGHWVLTGSEESVNGADMNKRMGGGGCLVAIAWTASNGGYALVEQWNMLTQARQWREVVSCASPACSVSSISVHMGYVGVSIAGDAPSPGAVVVWSTPSVPASGTPPGKATVVLAEGSGAARQVVVAALVGLQPPGPRASASGVSAEDVVFVAAVGAGNAAGTVGGGSAYAVATEGPAQAP